MIIIYSDEHTQGKQPNQINMANANSIKIIRLKQFLEKQEELRFKFI